MARKKIFTFIYLLSINEDLKPNIESMEYIFLIEKNLMPEHEGSPRKTFLFFSLTPSKPREPPGWEPLCFYKTIKQRVISS